MDAETRQLAVEIIRCPVVEAVLRGEQSPCRKAVSWQRRDAGQRWVPEPWSGHLDRAPILFLSSNPSSGDPDAAYDPNDLTASSDVELALNTFDAAFDVGPWIGIRDGTHLRAADGTPGRYVSFWGSCKRRASEILGRPADPGNDYALTEVVHCGSQHEFGVWEASNECVPRYLDRLLRLSPATVVIVIGSVAGPIARASVPALAGTSRHVGPIEWAGRRRHVLFLPHPNARGAPKGVAVALGDQASEILAMVRTALEDQAPLTV